MHRFEKKVEKHFVVTILTFETSFKKAKRKLFNFLIFHLLLNLAESFLALLNTNQGTELLTVAV